MAFCSRPALWWVLFGIWFLTLQVFSSFEGHAEGEDLFPHSDKLLHVAYFFAGSLTLAIALRLRWEARYSFWRPMVHATVLATGAVVGAFDEWHQSFVPLRSGNDIGDWGADILGAALACLLYPLCWKLLRIQPKIASPPGEQGTRESSG